MNIKKKVMITAILLIVLVSGFWLITKAITSYTGYSISEIKDLDGFVDCLSEKGAVLYLDNTHSISKEQKEIFLDSVDNLNIVDCNEEFEKCVDAGITQIPAWMINGEKVLGKKNLLEISKLSGCKLN